MTNQIETNAKAPTHTIYVVETIEDSSRSEWHKVGVAWEHNGGEGLNLTINSLGVSYLRDKGPGARLVIRHNKQAE